MKISIGQIVNVVYPPNGYAENWTVSELNTIGFIANGIQFTSMGVEYMQGIGHWSARYVRGK
jgi:hypothetical protein